MVMENGRKSSQAAGCSEFNDIKDGFSARPGRERGTPGEYAPPYIREMEEIGHTSNKATNGSGSTPAYFPGREEKALVYVATKRRGQENTGRVPSIMEIATDKAKDGRKLAKPMKRGQLRTGLRNKTENKTENKTKNKTEKQN